jgi:hypothetical protein
MWEEWVMAPTLATKLNILLTKILYRVREG